MPPRSTPKISNYSRRSGLAEPGDLATSVSRIHLIRAVAALRRGGVIAYPTEAVYGLGCDPRNLAAVRRVLALKRRPQAKGLILIAAEVHQLLPYLAHAPAPRALRTWPGPTTWLLPARCGVSRALRGRHATLAVRVTAHAVAHALCRAARGALISTSANRSGLTAARTALHVRRRFRNTLDYVLPGRVGLAARPTEIRDGRSGRIVRPG